MHGMAPCVVMASSNSIIIILIRVTNSRHSDRLINKKGDVSAIIIQYPSSYAVNTTA